MAFSAFSRRKRGLWLAIAGLLLLPFVVPQGASAQEEESSAEGSAEGAGGEEASGAAFQGQRAYIVSVPMEDGLEAVAQRAGAAARAALRGLDGVDWHGPDQRFLGYDDGTLTSLRRARERLNAGRQAYLQLDLDAAIQQLTGAVEDFDAAAAAMEDPEDLGNALLFLGASHAFNGNRREAGAVFGRLHTQMPHITPDENTFNPDVVSRFRAATPRDARSPAGSITISSDPPGAIAYVDFIARGPTPVTVDGLIGGDHIVRVTRAGAMPYTETVSLRGRRPTAEVNAFLQDQEATEGLADALGRIPQDDVSAIGQNSALAAVASQLDLETIGLIRVSNVSDGQVSLQMLLFDVPTRRRLARGEIAASTEYGELEGAVTRMVEAGLQAASAARHVTESASNDEVEHPWEEHHEEEGPSGPSIVEEWWFWTIIGVAVAAGVGVGLGVGLTEGQGPPLGQQPQGQVVFEF